jgi:uncharacterized membrane protein required for colicin V production
VDFNANGGEYSGILSDFLWRGDFRVDHCGAASRVLRWVGLSWFNYLLGGVAGFARGALVVAVLANVLVAFAPSPVPSYLRNSRVLPYANGVASVLAEFAPRQLKDSFSQQMENLKQIWAAHERRAG